MEIHPYLDPGRRHRWRAVPFRLQRPRLRQFAWCPRPLRARRSPTPSGRCAWRRNAARQAGSRWIECDKPGRRSLCPHVVPPRRRRQRTGAARDVSTAGRRDVQGRRTRPCRAEAAAGCGLIAIIGSGVRAA